MNAQNTNTNASEASPLPPSSSPPLAPSPLDLEPSPAPSLTPPTSHLSPQLAGESDRAFEAFRAYLELGPSRRYAAVANRVGSSVRTIRRWAADYNWRARVKACAAQSADEYAETQSAIRRDDMLDVAARIKGLRDRQYAVAESLLDAAELYLGRIESLDLDQMSFSDACKALQVAVHLGKEAASQTADPSDGDRSLRDQLATLLDQAYREAKPKTAITQPA